MLKPETKHLPIFAAIDCAPSEQLGNMEQMHTFALVYFPSSECMDACVDAMNRTANDKNFSLGQYRSKTKTRSYARKVLASLENEECRKWMRVFLVSHRAREICDGEEEMFKTLQLHDWCRVQGQGDSKQLAHNAGSDGSGNTFPCHSFSYGQGIMVVWMSFSLRLVWKLLEEIVGSKHRWHIVSDQIAGDNIKTHHKAVFFSACLTWFDSDFTMQCSYEGKDKCADLADTFAGIGSDCLSNIGNPKWDEIRTKFLMNPHLSWAFKTGPPWPEEPTQAHAGQSPP